MIERLRIPKINGDYLPLICFGLISFVILQDGDFGIRKSQMYFFIVSSLVAVAWGNIGKLKNPWFTAFLTYASLYQVFLFSLALFKIIPHDLIKTSFSFYLFIMEGSILYSWAVNSKIELERIYNVICVVAILQGLIGFAQFVGADPIYNLLTLNPKAQITHGLTIGTVCGTLENPNFFAGYMAISLAFFFRRGWIIFIPLILFTIWAAHTATANLAVIIGISVHLFGLKNSRWALYLGAIYFLIFETHHINFNNGERFDIWLKALNYLFESWLSVIIGLSPGLVTTYPLHNDYLDVWLYFGAIGLGLMLGYIFTMNRQKGIVFTACVISCIDIMGNYALQLPPSAFLIIIVFGLNQRIKEERI